jgi:hypothetical protein
MLSFEGLDQILPYRNKGHMVVVLTSSLYARYWLYAKELRYRFGKAIVHSFTELSVFLHSLS